MKRIIAVFQFKHKKPDLEIFKINVKTAEPINSKCGVVTHMTPRNVISSLNSHYSYFIFQGYIYLI